MSTTMTSLLSSLFFLSLLIVHGVRSCGDTLRACDNEIARCDDGLKCINPSKEPLGGCCHLVTLNGYRVTLINGEARLLPPTSEAEQFVNDFNQAFPDSYSIRHFVDTIVSPTNCSSSFPVSCYNATKDEL